MITRFVYPKLDTFFAKRNMPIAKQLLIASTTDDGKLWFGIKEAIESYCEEYGCSVNNVRWMVKTKVDRMDDTYKTIIATDINDWEQKFNALHAEFERI